MSYGTSYHNGEPCDQCGATVLWEHVTQHRHWHESILDSLALDKLRIQFLYEAVQDLVQLVYAHDPGSAAEAQVILDHRWGQVDSTPVKE